MGAIWEALGISNFVPKDYGMVPCILNSADLHQSLFEEADTYSGQEYSVRAVHRGSPTLRIGIYQITPNTPRGDIRDQFPNVLISRHSNRFSGNCIGVGIYYFTPYHVIALPKPLTTSEIEQQPDFMNDPTQKLALDKLVAIHENNTDAFAKQQHAWYTQTFGTEFPSTVRKPHPIHHAFLLKELNLAHIMNPISSGYFASSRHKMK